MTLHIFPPYILPWKLRYGGHSAGWRFNALGIMYDWTPPEGVDRRVHLRSLLPTIEVDGKQYLEGGRLGAVQEDAVAAAATAAASSSAGEDGAACHIM